MYFRVYHKKSGECIASQVEIAKTFVKRMIGLLGRSKMTDGQGLYLSGCSSVHSFFMRFSIDVIFLDKEMKITRMVNCLKPNRVAFAPLQTLDTLELPCGVLEKHDLKVGDLITLKERQNERYRS